MQIIVNPHTLELNKTIDVNSGEYNVNTCEFIFSSEYEELTKMAIFSNEENSFQTIITNGTCIIPAEILQTEGTIGLGVYGYEVNGDNLVKRYSPKPVFFNVELGSYQLAQEAEEPSADIIAQILAQLGTLSNDVETINETIPTLATKEELSNYTPTNELSPVSLSGNYNDLSNKPTIPDIIQYSIIPTASVETVGKIIQYTGTTTQNYINGYFYIGTTDGTNYSWENINVQAGGEPRYIEDGTGARLYIIKYSTDIDYQNNVMKPVFKEVINNLNYSVFIDDSRSDVAMRDFYHYTTTNYTGIYKAYQNNNNYFLINITPAIISRDIDWESRLWSRCYRVNLTVSQGEITSFSFTETNPAQIQYLSTNANYSTPYTPTYAGSPTNKKYVDDSISNETTARENADIGLQGQIDAITSSSDVVDIVGTYQDLQNYDTQHLGNNDVIKVLQDSTHNDAMTYYRWLKDTSTWQYIGQEGPYYTKSEIDTTLQGYVEDSDLTDYVKNTDYATSSVGGVIKATNGAGIYVSSSGVLYATEKSYNDYASFSNNGFISKGTLENVITGKGLVSNTDYASENSAGVIIANSTYGINMYQGKIAAASYTYERYQDKVDGTFISKRTLENVLTARIGDISNAIDLINGESI